jgi:hypothetical protein
MVHVLVVEPTLSSLMMLLLLTQGVLATGTQITPLPYDHADRCPKKGHAWPAQDVATPQPMM